MTPTTKAVAIAPYLNTVITSINRCAQPEKELQVLSPRKNIYICAPEYFELLLLPAFSEATINGPPGAAVQIDRLRRELPAERLLAGKLDLACGFGPGYHRIHPDLDWEPLIDDSFVCLSGDRNIGHPALTIESFCAARHAFPTPWDSATNMVDSWLHTIGRKRTIVLRANSYQACINALRGPGLLLSLPRRLLPLMHLAEGTLVCTPPLGFPTFTLDLIWSRNRDQETRWLRQKLKESVKRLQ